jgi:uncharacterized membrane protein (UPF0127 family)
MTETVTVLSRAGSVCESCAIADTIWSRLRGLMGRRGLESGEGLLLRPAGSVHTCFMRFAIDVVFLDSESRVLAVSPAVRPWRLRLQRGARAVLELPAGEAERVGIAAGDHLAVGGSATSDKKENVNVLV